MTIIELAILVRDTRNAQAVYFDIRSQEALRVARRHERVLDHAIATILFESAPPADLDTNHD